MSRSPGSVLDCNPACTPSPAVSWIVEHNLQAWLCNEIYTLRSVRAEPVHLVPQVHALLPGRGIKFKAFAERYCMSEWPDKYDPYKGAPHMVTGVGASF